MTYARGGPVKNHEPFVLGERSIECHGCISREQAEAIRRRYAGRNFRATASTGVIYEGRVGRDGVFHVDRVVEPDKTSGR